MQQLTQYEDTCRNVGQEMQQQAQKAIDAGIDPWRIILDPGEVHLQYSSAHSDTEYLWGQPRQDKLLVQHAYDQYR